MSAAAATTAKAPLELALLRVVGLTSEEVAAVAGTAPEKARRWLVGAGAPRGRAATRLEQLASVVQRLSVLVDATEIAPWLRGPIDALDGQVPLELMAAGGYERVSGIVSELEFPTFT